MTTLDDEIFNLLSSLDQTGALKHLLLIGSWATLLYKDYFNDSQYHPVIRTTDIDFLLPKKPPANLKINLPKMFEGMGFLEEFTTDGWVTFHKPELHVEFLCPRLGQQSDTPRKIPELGVNARPLRFMSLMTRNTIQCTYSGIKVNLPHPAIYGLHKLIISSRRPKDFKRENDRQQAELVLTTLSNPSDITLLHEIYQLLSKKEKTAISEAIEGRPLLREIFRAM